MRRALLTGFEPFGGADVIAPRKLIEALAGRAHIDLERFALNFEDGSDDACALR